jgi:hypothetical protein
VNEKNVDAVRKERQEVWIEECCWFKEGKMEGSYSEKNAVGVRKEKWQEVRVRRMLLV